MSLAVFECCVGCYWTVFETPTVISRIRGFLYEKPTIQKRDALKYELINFVNSVQKKEKPLVDGLSGRNALEIAMKIQNKIIENKNGY